ncbi:hypothetical protein NEIELOOT_01506 [Neisseria elongata subsp. glycolytica ATCC 29315]|uniref:Uncharacterized protein n=1 Tax=Neisseria elongata subsp. glycolytica ATCC 29315 TaxID=546263 RepID=D4DR13_NEIEG|nr:hypothetical protein NEIELOOT_01506 [Neisseria elongata subsp. glycolytica ATCC 29315]
MYCFFRRPVSSNFAIFHPAEGHCSIQNQLIILVCQCRHSTKPDSAG